jgi:LmbE family N-acetylglucosaminyl deacetylase/2-polyprenyl-3-methyl-5-hydroxy-6-metoxy-1,4-benzoquinol methylase
VVSEPSSRLDVRGTPAEEWWRHPGRAALPELSLLDRDGHPVARVVVVAAHPAAEVLGAGGVAATAAGAGVEVAVVVLTDGEGSHPASTTTSPAELAAVRRAECRAGLERLGAWVAVAHVGLPDGRLEEREQECAALVTRMVGDGRGVLLVAPYRHDGEPDHEAAGRAAAAAASRTGARLLEYPVWMWHWSSPDTAAWSSMCRLSLSPDVMAAKQQALAAHRSQVVGLSAAAGDERVLGEDVLAHFLGAQELFVEEPPEDPTLDRLHREVEEPWGADTRWYEVRKRALLGALLPARSFRRGLDVGCSTGATTADLARRCDELVAIDESPAGLMVARRRLADQPHVSVLEGRVPDDLPDGPFDLVVVSEVGFFLSPRDLERFVRDVDRLLAEDGVVVLCHWRHPVEGWVLDGPRVHRTFEAVLGRERLAAYVDRDVEMLLLGPGDALPAPTQ